MGYRVEWMCGLLDSKHNSDVNDLTMKKIRKTARARRRDGSPWRWNLSLLIVKTGAFGSASEWPSSRAVWHV